MDLKASDRSLDEIRYKLQPPPPRNGTPIHRISSPQYATPTISSSRRSSKTHFEPTLLQDRKLNKPSRAPSPGRLKELSTDRSRFFLDMERKKEEEEARARELAITSRKNVTTEAEATKAAERLFNEAKRREARLAQLRLEERERERMENVPPPSSSELASSMCSTPRTPLHERAEWIIRQREENLSKVRMALEAREYQHLHEHQRVVDPREVTERLLSEAEALQKKKDLDRLILLEMERPRGVPQINDHSKRIFEHKQGERRMSFVERQHEGMKEREQRLIKKQAEDAAKSQLKATKVVSPKTVQKTVRRLAEEDAIKLKESRESAEQKYFGQFNFAPQIDERSKMLAPKGSGGIENLYKNETALERKQRLVEKIEKERMKDCTFRPMVLPNAYWMQSRDEVERRAKQREQQREERLRKAKWELEMKEASECTFRPFVNSSVSATASRRRQSDVVEIKGIDQYLERKRQAEEMKELHREREEKVFLKTLPPLTRRYTIAQPFNLSG